MPDGERAHLYPLWLIALSCIFAIMAINNLQEIKEEIKSRINIVDVAGNYTRLKPQGKNFVGLCPFHADKRPSFRVSPSFQSYRCWSCGEKGDLFTFVEKKENLTFIEALEVLAKRAGVPFQRTQVSAERASEREEMHAINSLAVRFFRDRFNQSPDALRYLNSRAILKETQDRFDIGYAPPDWEALVEFLQRNRINMQLAEQLGLVRKRKDSSGWIDNYRHRLMFPIHDLLGNVAGFGGRAMGDEQPKYLNSPQSVIFNKSRLLYGLFFARQRLSSDVPPVFVEGYVDVVTAHQAGFTQCVATLGTAMTEEHARTLVRYNRKVILCYDGDTAGINATLKGAAVWDNMDVDGAQLLVASLPEGDDPDSMLRRGDTALFQKTLDAAIPRIDFELDLILNRHNTSREEGREAALREMIPVLSTIQVRTRLDKYVQRISRLHPMYNFNVTRALESILADIQTYRQQQAAKENRQNNYASVEQQNRQQLAEQPNSQQPYTGPRQSQGFNPNTANWQRNGNRPFNKNWRNEKQAPPADMRPPDLSLPALSAADKAERTLLRAMFDANWRTAISLQINSSLFDHPLAARAFDELLVAPCDADGKIDPAALVDALERQRIELLSDTKEADPFLEESVTKEHDPFAEDDTQTDEDPFKDDLSSVSASVQAQLDDGSVESNPDYFPFPDTPPPDDNDQEFFFDYGGSDDEDPFAKLSAYIVDLLEESDSILSNEPLNEHTIAGCIRRLHERRAGQKIRNVKAELERTDLTFQQRKDLMDQLMVLTRAKRGTPQSGV
jgi:DNA primase